MQNTRRYLSKDLKIAIIGAGISGLTAAHTLKKFGYNNVTIFESGAEAGGKIHTLEMDGHLYELGAIFVPDKADTISSLAKDYNVTLTKQLKKEIFLTLSPTSTKHLVPPPLLIRLIKSKNLVLAMQP